MSPLRVTVPTVAPAPRATTVGPANATPANATVTGPADSFAATSSGAARVFPAGDRRWGSWEWNTAGASAPVLDALVTSQKASGATELYVNAYPLVGRERFLADALGRAADAGLSPQLLLGAPEWCEPATRPWLETSIVAPLRTIAGASTAPVTLHLDVEPHATGPLTPEKMRGYLDTLDWFRASLPGVSLQVDIPAWYAGQSVDGRDFAKEILQRVDGVTLMAYARTAPQVLADVAPTLEAAAALGKQAMVAVEAGPQHAAVGLGTQSGVRQFLATLDTRLANTPGYGGCALHDFDAMKRLPP